MQENPVSRLKITLIVGAVVVAMAIIFIVVSASGIHLGSAQGRLVITTNPSDATISLGQKSDTQFQTLTSGKTVSVAPGDYTVTVENSNAKAAKLVHVTAGQTSSYTINLVSSALTPDPVADVNALDFTVGPSILYMDQQNSQLYQVDSGNRLSALGPVAFNNISWAADGSYGVGADDAGNVYVINNGNVTKLAQPGGGTTELVSVAPNHLISLAYGTKIYQGTPATGFKLILTAGRTPSYIQASNNSLALVTTGHEGSSGKDNSASIKIINSAGQGTEKAIDAYQTAWSPSGKYFLVTADSGTEVYDTSLNLVKNVPYPNLSNPVWLNDDSLLFNIHDQLWQYDLGAELAHMIAKMPTDHAIANIVPSPDHAYVYLSVQYDTGSNDDLFIQRLGLRGQQPSAVATTLQAKLPSLTTDCLISLVNFTHPTIQMIGRQDADCLSQAQDFVTGAGADATSVSYQRTTISPNEPTGQ